MSSAEDGPTCPPLDDGVSPSRPSRASARVHALFGSRSFSGLGAFRPRVFPDTPGRPAGPCLAPASGGCRSDRRRWIVSKGSRALLLLSASVAVGVGLLSAASQSQTQQPPQQPQ